MNTIRMALLLVAAALFGAQALGLTQKNTLPAGLCLLALGLAA